MKYFLILIAYGFLVSCSNQVQNSDFDFLNADRPDYTKTIDVEELSALDHSKVTLIDVRLTEDFEDSPELILGATHRNPEMISEWAHSLPKDKPVVVYCVKGKWVSQKAATYLSENGYEVYSLNGGINAWKASTSKRP